MILRTLSTLIYSLSLFSFAEASVLTKQQAYEMLKSKGFKWNLTKTLNLEAEAKRAASESELKPQFQLGFRQYVARINPIQYGGADAQTIDTIGFGTTAIEMSWLLMDVAAKAKILSAEANEKMSGAQAKHYQNELTALMLIQYLNVQRLNRQLDVMDANIAKSQLILKLVAAKKSVGAGIPLEVARAKNLLKLDQLKKVAVYTKYIKAKHELALSLSEERLDFDLEALQPSFIPPAEIKSVLQKSLDSRNDLKAAEFGLESANGARDETKKMYFPKLQFLGQVGSTQPTLLGLPGRTLGGFLGFSLSIPLETGGLLEAKRRETETLQQLMAAEEAVRASDDYVKTANEEAQIAESKYSSGASNILDFTSAHTNLASANDTRIENVFNYEAAKVNYYRTLGDFTEYFALGKGE
jgi:outer membrane protein TolC